MKKVSSLGGLHPHGCILYILLCLGLAWPWALAVLGSVGARGLAAPRRGVGRQAVGSALAVASWRGVPFAPDES